MKFTKYHYHVFDDKRYVLHAGIYPLTYFHKNCNKKKRFTHERNIIIIK